MVVRLESDSERHRQVLVGETSDAFDAQPAACRAGHASDVVLVRGHHRIAAADRPFDDHDVDHVVVGGLVIDGEIEVQADGNRSRVSSGGMSFVPKGVAQPSSSSRLRPG